VLRSNGDASCVGEIDRRMARMVPSEPVEFAERVAPRAQRVGARAVVDEGAR